MARKCFYSFQYVPDNWRVSKIRNIGAVEENKPASDNVMVKFNWNVFKPHFSFLEISGWVLNNQ